MNPTLYDVAREAGVSLATASRAINGSSRVVKDEYRERVLVAARKLGYTANVSAQAVARGSSSSVALIVSDIADPYFSAIAAGVLRAADAVGLVVTIAVTNRDAGRELELVKLLGRQRPRVMVLAGSRFTDEDDPRLLIAELDDYQSGGGRVAFISQTGLPFATVEIDNTSGARALGAAAVSLGYRRFVVLAGPEHLATARDRSAGFASALPVPPVAIAHGDFTRDGGYSAMSSLLDDGLDGADFVFAVNDVMAVGALAALRDRGVPVPEQIAVAGFDDVPIASDVTPPLTTVRVALEEVGEASVAIALGADVPAPITPEVILRSSTPAR
ncbi:LacI family transcriptional regulator [Microbacteriaceae bacterium SG_E_30_P1]|uniref:LacI family transcriptional regulator n=1 Tax=Antiquaquibacter oligotrophicus TaxID=2880260 RepID=A0ABT6KQ80_9MICO|nr:LacI family DNA-binding transcriptional regulator [Antiquaquibacter oligotrophicus]MDH6182136.1 LacI family transcriptional regulator [Antiquaquibacter oligotrophicus]UDF12201.1 LacI family transcriptional regulator [Antiquaquibacter oligotrophicus]